MELLAALTGSHRISSGRRRVGCAALLGAGLCVSAGASPVAVASARPSVLLVTLDTTRADVIGAWGGTARTPALDGLAARGVRFASAWSSSPLTLPAHAALFSGRTPGEHGLRDNGLATLEARFPLVAEAFAGAGYRTGAAVASRILDRRFGLDRGFAHYDDRMVAERTGEFGYPERRADEVVDAALSWLRETSAPSGGAPVFLWVHFYDPHAPYLSDVGRVGGEERERYAAEVERVDRELGRLLAALPNGDRWLVAAVGDHGEAFGEQGEREHGLLLQRATLEVPLILAGPGVPSGRVVAGRVAALRLASTLVRLAGVAGSGLGGAPLPLDREPTPAAIAHESWYPASVYGWSPLVACTLGESRLVVGPAPRWYELAPEGERQVVDGTRLAGVRPLARCAREYLERHPFAGRSTEPDETTRRELSALGYLSGTTGRAGTLDPADGVRLVARFDEAGAREAAGDVGGALTIVRELMAASPSSVPFLSRAASLEKRRGEVGAAEALLRRALELQPESEFLRLHLGLLLLDAGRVDRGEAEIESALERDPTFASAWLALAESARRRGDGTLERRRLDQAIAAGTASAALHARRAQILLASPELDLAESDARTATELLPEWDLAWLVAGEVAERGGRIAQARERYRRAAELGGTAATEARRRYLALLLPGD